MIKPTIGAGVLALACAAACAPEPFYDDTIGVPGVATEEGALAGSWAAHYRFTRTGYVPILAREVESVGDQVFLVERLWDEELGVYNDQWKSLCLDVSGETAGLSMRFDESTLNSVGLFDGVSNVEHDNGMYTSDGIVELWGLHNLPNLRTTPVPTPDNYQDSPQRDWVYDSDGDGEVGCTSHMSGLVNGEGYFIKRAITNYRGVIRSPDQVFGFIIQTSAWATLESTVSFAVNSGTIPSDDAKQHDDPRQSWFEHIRIADGAGCDEVKAAYNNKDLSTLRPF